MFKYPDNVRDVGDNDFGIVVGKVRTGVVLFYASWCYHSKMSLRLIPKLSMGYNNLYFLRVEISKEGKNGNIETVNPKIKECLGISRYPQWGTFKNGIFDPDLVITDADFKIQENKVKKLIHDRLEKNG